jgi:hypothetical protein
MGDSCADSLQVGLGFWTSTSLKPQLRSDNVATHLGPRSCHSSLVQIDKNCLLAKRRRLTFDPADPSKIGCNLTGFGCGNIKKKEEKFVISATPKMEPETDSVLGVAKFIL